MILEKLPHAFTVCKLSGLAAPDLSKPFCFYARTDREISLVCRTEDVPDHILAREDGWRVFRIQGTLDFSLTGVLSGIAAVLAENRIGIFAISTYDTDYILVKDACFDRALDLLASAGYAIAE